MSSLGFIHSLAAATAILSGMSVVARPKGTGNHVRNGRIYVLSMLVLNISALGIYRITGRFGAFHVGALLSLVTLSVGIGLLRLRWTGRLFGHGYCMLWSYLGLMAAAVSEFATHVLRWPASRGVVATSVGVFVVGGILVHTRGKKAIVRLDAQRLRGGADGTVGTVRRE